MDLAEIRRRLEAALTVRIPGYDPNMHPRERVQKLEEYIVRTAEVRQELEEALYWCEEAGKLLRRRWDEIVGYEQSLPRGSRPTKEHVDLAKAIIEPGTWQGLNDARTLLRSLHRQIRRMELDYDATSRSYTLMSGA